VEDAAMEWPVIVHKSGGPFEDITEYGEHSLYYNSVEELAEKISKLLTDRKSWEYYGKLLQRSANSVRNNSSEISLKL
jgi:glycosyltransferase involved in cell wall biosynthesis